MRKYVIGPKKSMAIGDKLRHAGYAPDLAGKTVARHSLQLPHTLRNNAQACAADGIALKTGVIQ
jgi:hypothetical protein